MVAPPDDLNFRANVAAVHGAAGIGWLSDIPRLVAELERSWGLRVGSPYELSYNYVVPVTRSTGQACVLKLSPPGFSGYDREADALSGFAGRGAVKLLDHDDSRGALLLERADPGRSLAEEFGPDRDEEATAVAGGLMLRLSRRPPVRHRLPDVIEYGADFAAHRSRYGNAGPIPQRLVDQAADLLEQLSDSAERTVLLHGDLHHHNILRAGRESWLAIDPHGLIGDPGFDVGAMLYNPVTFDAELLLRLLPTRLEQLADVTGLRLDRVVAWGLVMAVLSEVWSSEDNDEIDGRPLALAGEMSARC